jgi:hypothetical protein
MKPVHAKRSAQHHPQPLRHEALTSMSRMNVEAQVAGLEDAADDLAQVDHANKVPRVATA